MGQSTDLKSRLIVKDRRFNNFPDSTWRRGADLPEASPIEAWSALSGLVLLVEPSTRGVAPGYRSAAPSGRKNG
jgi:hypothetical protein